MTSISEHFINKNKCLPFPKPDKTKTTSHLSFLYLFFETYELNLNIPYLRDLVISIYRNNELTVTYEAGGKSDTAPI